MYRIFVIMCRKNIKKTRQKTVKDSQKVQTAGYNGRSTRSCKIGKGWNTVFSIEPLYDGMTELGLGFRGLFWFYRNS